jgi:hypothetical protein
MCTHLCNERWVDSNEPLCTIKILLWSDKLNELIILILCKTMNIKYKISTKIIMNNVLIYRKHDKKANCIDFWLISTFY